MLNACLPLSLKPRIITYTFLKMLLHILKFKSKVIMAEKRFTWGKNYLLKMSKYFIPKERNNHLIATKSFYKECSLFPLLKYQSLFILRAETRGWRTNSSASFTRQSRVFFSHFSKQPSSLRETYPRSEQLLHTKPSYIWRVKEAPILKVLLKSKEEESMKTYVLALAVYIGVFVVTCF